MKIIFNCICLLIISLITMSNVCFQDDEMKDVDYEIVAEGLDSPMGDFHVVCLNKYFNLDFLPESFRVKYLLNNKTLYRKKMLVEIFRTDNLNKGLDKIEIVSVKSNEESLVISYNLVNSDTTNDSQDLNPFLIIQTSKMRKNMVFIADGVELEKPKALFVK